MTRTLSLCKTLTTLTPCRTDALALRGLAVMIEERKLLLLRSVDLGLV